MDLAAEEEWLDAERSRLAEAWGKLHEVVETSRKVDDAVCLRREEARHEAKEIRESAATEAEKILEEVREKLAEVEAHEGGLATREFACEEAFAAHEKAREETFAAHEKALAAREGEANSKLQELQRREEETTRHEGSLELRENELCTERSCLEMLESQRVLAVEKASYDERVKKANARLTEKEKEAWEQNAQKLMEDLEKVREEFHAKAKSQEERFTSKQKELKK
jgi:hypothetical protein